MYCHGDNYNVMHYDQYAENVCGNKNKHKRN